MHVLTMYLDLYINLYQRPDSGLYGLNKQHRGVLKSGLPPEYRRPCGEKPQALSLEGFRGFSVLGLGVLGLGV